MTQHEARVIYKYPLDQPLQQLPLRAGAVFRHLDVVKGQPVLWIEQPAEAPAWQEEVWTVRAVGTGHEFLPTQGAVYLGSGRCVETELVWHVFLLDRAGGAS